MLASKPDFEHCSKILRQTRLAHCETHQGEEHTINPSLAHFLMSQTSLAYLNSRGAFSK